MTVPAGSEQRPGGPRAAGILATAAARWTVPGRRGWRPWTLAAVLALVTVNAGYGGIGLIRDGLGMPTEWVRALPGGSWTLAGVALLITVGVPQSVACWLVVRGDRRAALVGVAVGLGLVAWIVAQLLILRRYFFLQPVIAGLGLVETSLALGWIRSTAPRGEHRSRH